MGTSVEDLLGHDDLGLRVAAGVSGPGTGALGRELAWAHSSDLADPTPWLEPGGLLLTDGVDFLERADAAGVDAYVRRLADAGVIALGFAVGVAHTGLPPHLRDACERRGMPLLEVPRATPFMRIIRTVADGIAQDRRARLEWSLDAQRAIARAAVRPDALAAILAELEQRLGTWVTLYDAAGAPIPLAALGAPPAASGPATAEAVRTLLAGGVTGTVRIDRDGATATVQTIGRAGALRGALAVGAPAPLDAAGNDVVTFVLGLAAVALEQSRTLDTTRRTLRSGVLSLLLGGAVDEAREAAAALGGLPAAPFRIAVARTPAGDEGAAEALELAAQASSPPVFVAPREGETVLIGADGSRLAALLARHGLRGGISGEVGAEQAARGLAEARSALTQARASSPVVAFDALAEAGVLGFLAAHGGEAVARRRLAPLLEDPAASAAADAVAVWLAHLGQWDPAARELGIHRQTLRARVAAAGAALGLDLSRAEDRAELWAALSLVGRAP